ncbi:MAG: hypothetical protein KDD29_10790, partial [Flavobacteriales bacterium]|nr:hypothetical protein [Flavobacteriales bacterium]
METTKSKKFSYLSILGVVGVGIMSVFSPNGDLQPEKENQFIKDVKSKLENYNATLGEDRMYLHLDKPMYESGDNIWFSAYIRNGLNLKPSDLSDIVHVELISPKGTVQKKLNLVAKNGIAAGDFKLDNEALGGIYKVRAYTNWMKNSETLKEFEKEIQVQDVVLPNLKMKLDFEKKAFGAGDEVIAKLKLETNENKALNNHNIKYVVNIDGNKILAKDEITDEEGMH